MDVYEKLRVILDAHPSGAPKTKSFDEIMRILFTPEEAEIATRMNFSPRPLEAIASDAGISPEDAETMLETMADRPVVFSREKGGKKFYGLLPTIPGLFEFPFMKGGGTPMHDRLAALWKEYHDDGLGMSFSGNPTPMTRVVPVRQALDVATRVYSYEEVARLIDNVDYIGLAPCACRVSANACDHPREVCLIFDGMARFLVERGYAREIDREEARKVLDLSEDAGLVHTSNNSVDKATLICNCCPCCCTILTCKTHLDLHNAFATSGFKAVVDVHACTGCSICADERCPMGAIEIIEDVAEVASEKCIGCGLCVSGCPFEAITLERRSKQPDVPETIKDMVTRVLKEKGKLEQFMKVMKR
jgi:electron transport complex protein RnfB